MALARRRRSLPSVSSNGTSAGNSSKGKEREREDVTMDVDGAGQDSPADEVRSSLPPRSALCTPTEDVLPPHIRPQQVTEQIASLRSVLAARTAALQLRSFPAGPALVAGHNASVRPSKLKDFNDPFRIEWLGSDAPALIFGDELERVPPGDEWEVCRPIVDRRLSTAYASEAAVVGDVQLILEWALHELLEVASAEMEVRDPFFLSSNRRRSPNLRALASLLLFRTIRLSSWSLIPLRTPICALLPRSSSPSWASVSSPSSRSHSARVSGPA
jgi:hypothetical protein